MAMPQKFPPALIAPPKTIDLRIIFLYLDTASWGSSSPVRKAVSLSQSQHELR